MALTFFWRAAGETLDGTDDYSAGDTTATVAGTAAIGSNGIEAVDAADYYYLNPTSIAATAEGAAAFSIQFPSAVPASGYDFGIRFRDSGGTNYMGSRTAGSSTGFAFRSAKAGATNTTTTSGVTISIATWYSVVLRWDFVGDLMRIEVYDASGNLLGTPGEDTASDTSDYEPTGPYSSSGFQIGNISSQNIACYLRNIFVADDYAEPLEDFLNITSYTQYGVTPPAGGDLVLPQFYQRPNTLLRM
jgi:hypothetical protein